LLQLVDYDPETGIFTRGGAKVGTGSGPPSNRYCQLKVAGSRYLAHRLAWFYVHGIWPEHGIDHKDNNRLNNRISNLRLASASQNAANKRRPATNTTGFKGVRAKPNNRWRSEIQHNGKSISLGTYATKEEAHAAYCSAAQRLFGEFARAA
jgi:hypothetical protein